jgi:flagellar hook-associated protein 1
LETAVLATSLLNASSGLGTISRQIDLVSRNISRAGDADATAKVAALVTDLNGGVAVGRIDRTGNKTLLEAALSATSGSAGQKVTDDALSQLQAVIGQVSDQRSPAALIGKLADALQIYSANPADGSSAAAVVDAAKGIANGLNQASVAVAGVRAEADSQISAAVVTVRSREQTSCPRNKRRP